MVMDMNVVRCLQTIWKSCRVCVCAIMHPSRIRSNAKTGVNHRSFMFHWILDGIDEWICGYSYNMVLWELSLYRVHCQANCLLVWNAICQCVIACTNWTWWIADALWQLEYNSYYYDREAVNEHVTVLFSADILNRWSPSNKTRENRAICWTFCASYPSVLIASAI